VALYRGAECGVQRGGGVVAGVVNDRVKRRSVLGDSGYGGSWPIIVFGMIHKEGRKLSRGFSRCGASAEDRQRRAAQRIQAMPCKRQFWSELLGPFAQWLLILCT